MLYLWEKMRGTNFSVELDLDIFRTIRRKPCALP
jgi:hypothetical protein